MKGLFLISILCLLVGWPLASLADTHCPISTFDCRATAAEAKVKHDLPNRAFVRSLRQGCLHRGGSLAGLKHGYCSCMATVVAATPGEWRAALLAGLIGRPFNGHHWSTLPPLLSMQLHRQAHGCLEKTISGRPSGESTRVWRERLPLRFYARWIGRRVALQVREIRMREERRAMTHNDGEPVALPTGISHVSVIIAPNGRVIHIRNVHSTSMAIWRVERTAIRKASPFPPPHRRVVLRFATWANDPTPGA